MRPWIIYDGNRPIGRRTIFEADTKEEAIREAEFLAGKAPTAR